MKKWALLLPALAVGFGVLTPSGFAESAGDPPRGQLRPAVRLITQQQYVNVIGGVFGPSLRFPDQFAPIKRADGLITLGTSSAIVTGGALDKFYSSARLIAAQVVDSSHRASLVACVPAAENAPDDKCAAMFVSRVVPQLYRRPLARSEQAALVRVAHESAERLKDFYAGLGSALAGVLVSPEFLFVTQSLETQPLETPGRTQRLTAYAKASRLSLMLWNAYPDEALLEAARTGALHSDKGLAKEVDRMLASPRFTGAVRDFFDDMMAFEEFATLAKDSAIYPSFTHKVADDAKEQTLRTIVAHVIGADADYRDLFTTRKTFLTNDLGSIYGVSISRPEGWVPYEFSQDSSRPGLLTQISFLALYAHPGRSSATRRGRAIREVFLCQKVPPPPPDVDFSKFETPDPSLKTTRDRLSAHSKNPACAGCHKLMDPIGLSLENFDGAGAYRTHESGAKIDASGQLDRESFTDVVGLTTAVRNNPRLTTCLAERVTGYALGRPLRPEDRTWVSSVHEHFAANGYKVRELMRFIATSPSFYAVPADEEPQHAGLATSATGSKEGSEP